MKTRIVGALAVLLTIVLAASFMPSNAAETKAKPADEKSAKTYLVRPGTGSTSKLLTIKDRDAIARSGAAIDSVEHGLVQITSTAAEVAKLRRAGYRVEAIDQRAPRVQSDGATTKAQGEFHNYAQINAEIDRVAREYPNLVRVQTIGRSYQGRDIKAVKISANPGVDEAEPEVLFTHNIHARERLSIEMGLYELKLFTEGYATDPRIKKILDSREIWIVNTQNPDGAEYDINGDRYRGWRKNRQPSPNSRYIGTDVNRNFGFKWGCCGGSSGNPSSETYRGWAPFSSPEARVMRDFIRSRVVGGTQQIKSHIDFHSYSELVLWPYGFTRSDTAEGLDADAAAVFQTMGRAMARTNGYTAQQSSDLYTVDGGFKDWTWSEQKIFSFTVELYPKSASGLNGFYPPASTINRETSRNREAMLYLLEKSDCPYSVIGKPELCRPSN